VTALLAALVLSQPSLNLNVQPIESRLRGGRMSNTRQWAIDCYGGTACSVDGGVLRIWTADAGAASSSSGPPIDGGFVLWGGSVGSTNERTLTAGTSTSINTATAGQVKVDVVSPVATASALATDPTGCSANQFVTDMAAAGTLTCNQPSFSNLSGSATTGQLPTIPVTKGGTNLTTIAANQTWVGTSADTVTAKTLPSCSNATTSKLLYDNATQTWSCGTDQTGGGGGVSPLFVAQGSP